MRRQDDGRYSVTNLGALLFARKISDFPRVSRKAVRILQYQGTNRMEMVREIDVMRGYAAGFAKRLAEDGTKLLWDARKNTCLPQR